MFTPKDIENFNKIYNLVKTNGYTLDGAKKALKEKTTVVTPVATTSTPSHDEVIAKLEEIKSRLERLKRDY